MTDLMEVAMQIFFAVIILMFGIFIGFQFYQSIFPDSNNFEDFADRVNFALCGTGSLVEEKCTGQGAHESTYILFGEKDSAIVIFPDEKSLPAEEKKYNRTKIRDSPSGNQIRENEEITINIPEFINPIQKSALCFLEDASEPGKMICRELIIHTGKLEITGSNFITFVQSPNIDNTHVALFKIEYTSENTPNVGQLKLKILQPQLVR